jgi:hypothetical protein
MEKTSAQRYNKDKKKSKLQTELNILDMESPQYAQN